MDQLDLTYFLLYDPENPQDPILPSDRPVNLIIRAFSTGPLLAVAWHYRTKEWTFQPRVAMEMLHINPEDYQTRKVDRATAEREAPRFATKPLPSEAELTEICRAAQT